VIPDRADFSADAIARVLALQPSSYRSALSETELTTSREQALAGHPPHDDLVVFGYGSLIWNPAVTVAASAPAFAPGWRRSFCHELTFGPAHRTALA
jgi:cation transport protein ChaC